MLKKYVPVMLIVLLVNLLCSLPISAVTKEDEAKFIEKVKVNVTKFGTGKDAKVEVKLKDGTKIKGYIRLIYENSFVVVDEKTGAATEIPFPQTKQIKGNNLSTGAKIAIGIAIGVGVLALLALIGLHYAD